jgi:hypothetical protein
MANLLVTIRDSIAKIRPYIAVVFIVAFSIAPLISSPTYKSTVSVSLGLVLLYLFFDIYKELDTRLKGIETSLKEPNPPSFKNYTKVLPIIEATITEKLKENQDVDIKIIAVSAQYTWKLLIDETIPKLLKYGNKNPKIAIKLLIVKPEYLRSWGQRKLEIEGNNIKEFSPFFIENNKKYFEEGRIKLEIYEYDNIPQWHGILINNETLFMGRCKWKLEQERKELEVGQREYRVYKLLDRFRGDERIELFINWFDAYKFRASKISAH